MSSQHHDADIREPLGLDKGFARRDVGVPPPPKRPPRTVPSQPAPLQVVPAEPRDTVEKQPAVTSRSRPPKPARRGSGANATTNVRSNPVTVSLPSKIAVAVKRAAEERDLFQYEVLLFALDRHGEDVVRSAEQESPYRRRRRRGTPGDVLTTTAFRLTADQVERLDSQAAAARMSRAEFATRILQAELGGEPV